VIESLQAEHAVELGQAEQQAHDVIGRLLRKLATSEIRAHFESIYARIYGSQVAALRTLREAPSGAPRASVEAHLAQVKNDVSTRPVVWVQGLSFEEWFGYLQQQGLAEVGADQRSHITTMGTGSLAYIEGLGYARRASNALLWAGGRSWSDVRQRTT
jgi:IS30 family transposase